MRIENALSKYIVQLEADGRSRHTIAQYRYHVGLLTVWLRANGHDGEVRKIGHEDLARFLSSPRARTRPDGKPKRATSTNALRTSLRTFFRYVHDAGYTHSNPARLIRRALCGTPPPRSLSDEEQSRLLTALADARGPKARRDHALFALLLATGIRIGSALELEVDDVDLNRGELRVRTAKGNIPTTVFLGMRIVEILGAYIYGRDRALFPGQGGRPLSSRQAQRRLEQWCEWAGLHRSITPHGLRHSFALRIYRRTHDLLLLQAALHHKSIASTTIYARTDGDAVRKALGQ